MAITGSYSTSTGVNLNLVAYYSYTQNASNVTSDVTVTLKLRHKSISASALSGSYLSVAGSKTNYSKTISRSSDTETEATLATKTVTVSHNNETGQGSCRIKGTFVFNATYSGKYIGTLTIDETLTLQTIPRASGLSVPSSINTGSSLTLTITPADSTFKHKVQFKVGTTIQYTSDFISAGTKTFSYTIPHFWFPSSTSGSVVIYLLTYQSDGTYVANTYKTITANVPKSVIPTISTVTTTIINGLNGRYVQGKSSVKISVSASGGSGSSLSSYTINGESLSYSGSSSTATSGVIQTPNTLVYTVTVTDKRGRTSNSKTVSIFVQPYVTPRVTAIGAQRCLADGTLSNNGTYAKVSVNVSYSTIDGQNTLGVYLSNSKDDYATSQTILNQDSGTTTYIGVYGSEFLIDKNYIITASINDYYTAGIPLSATLKVSDRPFNLAKYNNGIAIGGFSTVTNQEDDGLLECYWPMQTTKNIRLISPNQEQSIIFEDCSSENLMTSIYKGDSQSNTVLGAWDYTHNRSIWLYSTSGDFYIDRPTEINGDMGISGSIISANNQGYRMMKSNGTDINIVKLNSTDDIVIGEIDGAVNGVYMDGVYNITTTSMGNMYIDSSKKLYRSSSSSKKYKENIQNIQSDGLNPNKLYSLPVREFKYKDGYLSENDPCINILVPGFIAEEVKDIYPIACEYNDNGDPENWNAKFIIPPMLKLIQDQNKEIELLKLKTENQQREIETLKAEINDMKTNN